MTLAERQKKADDVEFNEIRNFGESERQKLPAGRRRTLEGWENKAPSRRATRHDDRRPTKQKD